MSTKRNTSPVIPAYDPSININSSQNAFDSVGTGLRSVSTGNTLPIRYDLVDTDNTLFTQDGTTYTTNIDRKTVNQFLKSNIYAALAMPVVNIVANYTTKITDAGKILVHLSTDTNARTVTIASNSEVEYQLGTTLVFVNDSTGNLTIAINTDTLTFTGVGSTGSRLLSRYGIATAVKISSTVWYISGINLS